MASKISLSVFFPAYNEEENIKETIEKALKIIPKITNDYEIIVVDDGSKDKTADIVRNFSKNNKKIRLISHQQNKGYGIALKTGFENSKKDLIFYTDSDLQFNLDEIHKFLPYIKDYDLVIGYRIKRHDPFMRLLAAYVFSIICKVILRLDFKDADCAFKLCKKKVIDKIKPFKNTRAGDIELLVKSKKHRFKIKEIGVTHLPRYKGKSEAATLFNLIKPKIVYLMIKETLRLRKEFN